MSFITIVTLIFPTLSLTSGLVQILKGNRSPKNEKSFTTLMLLQTYMTFFFLGNTEDILKNESQWDPKQHYIYTFIS